MGNYLHGWGSVASRTAGQLELIIIHACLVIAVMDQMGNNRDCSQSHTCKLLLQMDFEHTFYYRKGLLGVTLGIISPRSPSVKFLCKFGPLGGCKEIFLLMQSTQISLLNLLGFHLQIQISRRI